MGLPAKPAFRTGWARASVVLRHDATPHVRTCDFLESQSGGADLCPDRPHAMFGSAEVGGVCLCHARCGVTEDAAEKRAPKGESKRSAVPGSVLFIMKHENGMCSTAAGPWHEQGHVLEQCHLACHYNNGRGTASDVFQTLPTQSVAECQRV